jgi:tetratricopeptide (TPR) repeat protein
VNAGSAALVVKRQPRPTRPPDVARNNPRTRPEVIDAKLSDADKGEAFKNQGNTYYDIGDFPKAIEAYLNALKHTPKDPVIYNNLGAA